MKDVMCSIRAKIALRPLVLLFFRSPSPDQLGSVSQEFAALSVVLKYFPRFTVFASLFAIVFVSRL